jgi:hypothetical protein
MNNKKAVINQIFVYLMSTIAILFVGFLVTKFIVAFTADSKDVIEDKFFSGLEQDVSKIASRYGSEEILDYKLNQEIKNVCFVPNSACAADLVATNKLPIQENEITLLAENANFLIFKEDGISSDKTINQYSSESAGNTCFCIQPNNGKFTLLIENKKNKVWISQYLE